MECILGASPPAATSASRSSCARWDFPLPGVPRRMTAMRFGCFTLPGACTSSMTSGKGRGTCSGSSGMACTRLIELSKSFKRSTWECCGDHRQVGMNDT